MQFLHLHTNSVAGITYLFHYSLKLTNLAFYRKLILYLFLRFLPYICIIKHPLVFFRHSIYFFVGLSFCLFISLSYCHYFILCAILSHCLFCFFACLTFFLSLSFYRQFLRPVDCFSLFDIRLFVQER